MSQPVQPLDLDEVTTRAAYLDEYALLADEPLQADLDQLTGTDVPAMAAELRQARAEIPRLRDRVTELEEARRLEWVLPQGQIPHTPRLCQCGHSHHAHTAPAPHSCFAHGQTCPCKAYRQLPHDEAVAQLKRNQQAAADRAAVETHVVADDSDTPEHTDAVQQPAEACGKCRRPFDPTDTAFDGRARYYLTPYCRSCVDRCHDTEIADHRCVICQ